MSLPLKKWLSSTQQEVYYLGPSLEEGPKPAIIYFFGSAYHTLTTDPFNLPIEVWVKQSIRIFSWDLPFHAKEDDLNESMKKVLLAFQKDPYFFTIFIAQCQGIIQELIQASFLIPGKIGLAGLSRGAFIATHLAAKEPSVSAVLGFAPLTNIFLNEEISPLLPFLPENIVANGRLHSLAPYLVDKAVHFYIGNDDTRVDTDQCYQFIQQLTQAAIAKGIRSPLTYLTIYPSIGYKGHGTPSSLFKEGALWLANYLTYHL